MSVTGDPQTQAAGSSSVPAEGVAQQPGTGVPSGDTGAAMSPAEVGEGAGTPDLAGLSDLDLSNPEVVKYLRENNYFTRDDLSRATQKMQSQAHQHQQRVRREAEARQAYEQRSQWLESQLRETVGEEEAENLLARFDRDNAQQQQALQQEREALAQEWVEGEQKSFQDFLMEAAYDGGRPLFDPNDPQLRSASSNFLAAVRAAALISDEDSLKTAHEWKAYLRSLVLSKTKEGLRGTAQAQQAGQPPQNQPQTNQQPARGRQVTSPGGAGGGVPRFGDLYKQNLESGMDPEAAFDQANLAVMTAGAAAS